VSKKNRSNTFNLAFLDIMSCGFGAVVLLVMILNGKILEKREESDKHLRAEVERNTVIKEFAEAHLAELRSEVAAIELDEGDLQVQADKIRKFIGNKQQENQLSQKDVQQREKAIEAMEKEKARIKAEVTKRQSKEREDKKSGQKLTGFDGEGRRQYLTGLKLGGERTLILIDASASMLDETIVNIVRRKLMNESIRRRSPKWTRVVRSVHWLVANLQSNKLFQVYYFNTEAHPVLEGKVNRWLDTDDSILLESSIAAVRTLAPYGGTNLHNAFDVVGRINPRPDSVILLTDGLPTLGNSKKVKHTVTGEERLDLFKSAITRLPTGIPINILLFPLEGDPGAASSYWELAWKSQGSFITPSRDWP
jgi:hypothetical protein